MSKSATKYMLVSLLLLCIGGVLAACGDTSGTSTAQGGTTPTSSQTGNKTTQGTASVPKSVTAVPGTPGIGPVVVLSPTPVPGGGAHSQQVVLKDRTLIINDVTRSTGNSANTVTVTLSIEIKNTSGKAINNQESYYLLTSTEGDSFGAVSGSDSFYGSIATNSSHSGTIVFQIPSVAAKGLHLMYHPEVAAETAFLPISLS